MKKLLYLLPIVIGLLVFSMCEKEEIIPSRLDSSSAVSADLPTIYDNWKLAKVSGGITGDGYEAKFDQLSLNRRGGYEVKLGDVVVSKGEFQVHEMEEGTFLAFKPIGVSYVGFDDPQNWKKVTYDRKIELRLEDAGCCPANLSDGYIYQFNKTGYDM